MLAGLAAFAPPAEAQGIAGLRRDFPQADLEHHLVPLAELRFDGARRDSIPPIDNPEFRPVADPGDIGAFEPVISVILNGDARAYPLRILLWHEIVNDEVGGVPVLVSYCPLCNSGVVFDRRLGGRLLTFGNTGRIRHFDMVMYDHATESFWQQFTGQAIVGMHSGRALTPIASRLESLASFQARAPDGKVLGPGNDHARPYGATPYAGMDSGAAPRVMQQYDLPAGIEALDYVVVVGNRAWPVDRLRKVGEVRQAGMILRWTSGRNSIHDTRSIRRGRDLGNVIVTDMAGQDLAHDVAFAFAFAAFRPQGEWMMGSQE